MQKRNTPTIGEQTGIKELDNVRQCGVESYNLYDVVKILNIGKQELKKICKDFEVETVDGELYVTIFQLKKILLRYNNKISNRYLGYVVHNDTELQEHGIVYDYIFAKDNENTELMNMIKDYRKQGINYEALKGNNYLQPNDFSIDIREITDDDIELIYNIIDEE